MEKLFIIYISAEFIYYFCTNMILLSRKLITALLLFYSAFSIAQINTDRVMVIGRNALYFEDYLLSIQYFNQVINVKPYLAEPYFYRAVAKYSLEDFSGVEQDCSLAIERNPSIIGAYECRAIARQKNNNLEGALEDYQKGLELDPYNKNMMLNKAITLVALQDTAAAISTLDTLIYRNKRFAEAYFTRANIGLQSKDTLQALQDINLAIELDKGQSDFYATRALVYYQREQYKESVQNFDEAIALNSNFYGYYFNRALSKYFLEDLRGTMADLDQVVKLDPSVTTAYFNRGLLRAQVGDDNNAIADFDKVIGREPDNYMALYNRAELRLKTGNLKGSISDLNKVLGAYPHFAPGFYMRSEAKRKAGQMQGAERDYFHSIKLNKQQQQNNNKQTADNKEEQEDKGKKTRSKNDLDLSGYNRIIIDQNQEEAPERKTPQTIRGKLQDQMAMIQFEPNFVLTYYEAPRVGISKSYYYMELTQYNRSYKGDQPLLMTNREAPLDSARIETHFARINRYSAEIDSLHSNLWNSYFSRAIEFGLIQDYHSAIEDYSTAINQSKGVSLIYFNRAAIRTKLLEYRDNSIEQQGSEVDRILSKSDAARDYELILSDYTKAIELSPSFYYAYYNRANIKALQKDYKGALSDYQKALSINNQIAEIWHNMGLVYIQLKESQKAIESLSKAGELGNVASYGVIKRVQNEDK